MTSRARMQARLRTEQRCAGLGSGLLVLGVKCFGFVASGTPDCLRSFRGYPFFILPQKKGSLENVANTQRSQNTLHRPTACFSFAFRGTHSLDTLSLSTAGTAGPHQSRVIAGPCLIKGDQKKCEKLHHACRGTCQALFILSSTYLYKPSIFHCFQIGQLLSPLASRVFA